MITNDLILLQINTAITPILRILYKYLFILAIIIKLLR